MDIKTQVTAGVAEANETLFEKIKGLFSGDALKATVESLTAAKAQLEADLATAKQTISTLTTQHTAAIETLKTEHETALTAAKNEAQTALARAGHQPVKTERTDSKESGDEQTYDSTLKALETEKDPQKRFALVQKARELRWKN